MKNKLIYYFFYDIEEYNAYKPFIIGLGVISIFSLITSLSALYSRF